MILLLGALLVWNANTEPDISGYRRYQGTNPRTYSQWEYLGNTTTNKIPDLTHGQIWYFAVTALNFSGLESDFSNEVAYEFPPPEPPVLSVSACTEDSITLAFDTEAGALYTVQSISDLFAPYWASRVTIEGTGLPAEVSLPKDGDTEYFRLRSL